MSKLSLQSKFILGVAFVCILNGIFFISTLYFHMKSLLVSEVRDKAHLVLEEISSVQDYVKNVLRPVMFKNLPPDKFILQAMSSSYISRKIMEKLTYNTPVYYRRVAFNARNPRYEPNKLEKKIIVFFRKHKSVSYEKFEKVQGKEFYITAIPVVFEQHCLHCHGKPQDAPKELVAKYGAKRGFFHKPGAIDGAVIIGFPIDVAVKQIKEATLGYVAIYSSMFFVFFALVSIYFRQLVILNFKKLTSIFKKHFSDPEELNLLDRIRAKDEIEELVLGMEELARHLYQTRIKLKDYATNLESKVQERTKELQEEVLYRIKDIELLVNLVDLLTRCKDSNELIIITLELISRRFDFSYAMYLEYNSNKVFIWPKDVKEVNFSKDKLDLDGKDRILYKDGWVYISVYFQSKVWGFLVLPENEFAAKNKQILTAIGKQMGIALESLQSIKELVYQYDIMQSVFDGISDPLFMAEEGGELVLQNEAARKLNKDFDFFHNFIALAEHREIVNRCWQKSESALIDWCLEEHYFAVKIYPLFSPPNELKRLIIYVRDVTHEKKMLEQIRRTEKLSAVGKLAAGLAHEINNPLGVILCYVDLLKETINTEQGLKDLKIIQKHALQAQKILRDLLNFARPKTSFGICNLKELVRNITSIFEVQAKKKKITFKFIDNTDLFLLRYDGGVLEQIFTNLILNAFDAVEDRDNPLVVVTLKRSDTEFILEVRDNGPGIAPEIKDLIFDPFFTTKEVGKGTGLGLAIVYRFVEEFGGKIEVFNQNGAVFQVFLPLKRDVKEDTWNIVR
ncbi:MAG: DUF3365 domain-containing protein [Desulfonauticus sp.]|nr:DUF3365 domain-containing protein [Desulfonauticus sp.]